MYGEVQGVGSGRRRSRIGELNSRRIPLQRDHRLLLPQRFDPLRIVVTQRAR